MSDRVTVGGLQIVKELYEFVNSQVIDGTGLESDAVWKGFAGIVDGLKARNIELIAERNRMQAAIDKWHGENPAPIDLAKYRAFLTELGYLQDEPEEFKVDVKNVDRELSSVAAPQLVVPIDNPRYALNAANARWGSLFDALYGTDAIPFSDGLEKGSAYNEKRGAAVFARAAELLDTAAPLTDGVKHGDVDEYSLKKDGDKVVLQAKAGDKTVGLTDAEKLVGYRGKLEAPTCILLKNNELHIEIHVDRDASKGHRAGVSDIVLEAAVSTIQDCEDSVAAVDAEDKIRVYRTWTGIMKANLETTFKKGGKDVTRKLNPDRSYTSVDGDDMKLPGRSVLLVRNVGIHMYTDAVLDADGKEIPEGFLDALVTAVAAKHDMQADAGRIQNSRTGSVYLVKPKMHGPAEVAFTVDLFGRVEKVAGLAANTLKVGVMDEERRTTVNLKRCIYEARERVVFINTGFLDRTGDEIHTSMHAGVMVPKTRMKQQAWQPAYEAWNVDVGLECGLAGTGQIGKGMWAQPDAMAAMLATKIGHLQAGATCGWVPSPTAATLHATHYHGLSVAGVQADLAANRARASLDAILTVPLQPAGEPLSADAITHELENNAQGILGYVVRWVNSGVGCSKVANLENVGLMEDRATLRISSQLLANWLLHGVIDETRLRAAFDKMSAIVNKQNASDATYVPLAADTIAFKAALDLVLRGVELDGGYTESVLHAARRAFKASQK